MPSRQLYSSHPHNHDHTKYLYLDRVKVILIAESKHQVVLWIFPEDLGCIVDPVSITLLQIDSHHLAKVPEKCVVANHRHEVVFGDF